MLELAAVRAMESSEALRGVVSLNDFMWTNGNYNGDVLTTALQMYEHASFEFVTQIHEDYLADSDDTQTIGLLINQRDHFCSRRKETLPQHWTCIRKINGRLFAFDSLEKEPFEINQEYITYMVQRSNYNNAPYAVIKIVNNSANDTSDAGDVAIPPHDECEAPSSSAEPTPIATGRKRRKLNRSQTPSLPTQSPA